MKEQRICFAIETKDNVQSRYIYTHKQFLENHMIHNLSYRILCIYTMGLELILHLMQNINKGVANLAALWNSIVKHLT